MHKAHRLNATNCQKAKNKSLIEHSDLMMKENSRKDLIKITQYWLQRTSKTSKVNESVLEIFFCLDT